MGRLSFEEILMDKQTSDPDSIVSLSLTHKAISDISCLRGFKNLERLDVSFNSLTSLEGLRECVNLKWLSVVQNKLQSLKGIEGLTKLTVLNAGKNKIRSVDEVQKLVNLRALIMNDNEIVSICKLDELKYLNTIVVSRNPLRRLSLDKLKLMSKLSLSNCQLESIDVSIKVCTELKELRLAHNDIKTLPDELAHNTKLQNLDLGNNLISKWSDLKILSSLHRLKNLNLHGNPIADNDKLVKKIRKLVPSIQIYNSKPIEKQTKKEQDSNILDPSVSEAHFPQLSKKTKINESDDDEDDKNMHASVELQRTRIAESNDAKELIASDENGSNEKRKKERKKRRNEQVEKETSSAQEDADKSAVRDKKVKTKAGMTDLKVIDDRDTPFWELLSCDTTAAVAEESRSVGEFDSLSSLVLVSAKKRKKSRSKGAAGSSALQAMPQGSEVGLGGPSVWDAE